MVWSDFVGAPDAASPYHALTKWSLRYQTGTVQLSGQQVDMPNFGITLEFDPAASWVKKGKETTELLRHEQGHFDLGLLCMAELLKEVKALKLTPDNFKPSLQGLFQTTLARYHELGLRYDKETDHGIKKDEQARWNTYLAEHLARVGK